MKIYQIHQFGGEWEDSFDYIVESYLSKEKAEKRKLELEQEEIENQEQWQKCKKCILWHKRNVSEEEVKEFCCHAEIEYDGDDMDCMNYYYGNDDSYFKIKEVEVIE